MEVQSSQSILKDLWHYKQIAPPLFKLYLSSGNASEDSGMFLQDLVDACDLLLKPMWTWADLLHTYFSLHPAGDLCLNCLSCNQK